MNIVFAPSPKLREKSKEVAAEEFGEDLNSHMDAMLIKMYESNGVGLSGVQIGDSRRILVADAGSGPMKIVNPKIIESSDEAIVYKEGCLSLPGFSSEVERKRYIRISYKTPMGDSEEGTLTDIASVIVQHEIDHLDGITLLDKGSRLKKNMYLKKLSKYRKKLKKAKKILSGYGY